MKMINRMFENPIEISRKVSTTKLGESAFHAVVGARTLGKHPRREYRRLLEAGIEEEVVIKIASAEDIRLRLSIMNNATPNNGGVDFQSICRQEIQSTVQFRFMLYDEMSSHRPIDVFLPSQRCPSVSANSIRHVSRA